MNRSRKDCTGGQACEPATIPEALHCLIEHSGHDVEALAAHLRDLELHASKAYLYELANPHRPDRGVRVLAIASALTSITRRSVLLRFLCRAHGGEFVQLPESLAAAAGGGVQIAADTLREFAQAMQAFADGEADQAWTVEEVERLEREGRDAIERILQGIAYAKRHASAALPEKASKMAKARPIDPWLAASGER